MLEDILSTTAKRKWWQNFWSDRRQIVIAAHAKVNFYLHVNEQRDDGYHDLESLLGFLEFHDRVSIRDSDKYHIIVNGPFVNAMPPLSDNLVTKAVNLIAEREKRKPNVLIELTKNIPLGSGLGGGSADAAAVLRGLQQLWGFQWRDRDFATFAKELGADVPACLYDEPSFVCGIGEIVKPAGKLPDAYFVLVYPQIYISTTEIFARLGQTTERDGGLKAIPNSLDDFIAALAETRNDLMHPALAMDQDILRAYRRLSHTENCKFARMTGSGSTCFGMFSDRASAHAAAKEVLKDYPHWWVRVTQLKQPPIVAPAVVIPPASSAKTGKTVKLSLRRPTKSP